MWVVRRFVGEKLGMGVGAGRCPCFQHNVDRTWDVLSDAVAVDAVIIHGGTCRTPCPTVDDSDTLVNNN